MKESKFEFQQNVAHQLTLTNKPIARTNRITACILAVPVKNIAPIDAKSANNT